MTGWTSINERIDKMSERLYLITYINDDDEEVKEIFPEYAIPEIDAIEEIELCGRLAEGYVICEEEEEPDDPEREDVPTPITRRPKRTQAQ